jgi:hypothetical protein
MDARDSPATHEGERRSPCNVGGRALTFGAPVLVQDDRVGCHGPLNDKPWIAVDTTPSGPHRGRLYLVWTQLPETLVERHSDDGGNRWSALRTIPSRREGTGAIALVGPNGSRTPCDGVSTRLRRCSARLSAFGPTGPVTGGSVCPEP